MTIYNVHICNNDFFCVHTFVRRHYLKTVCRNDRNLTMQFFLLFISINFYQKNDECTRKMFKKKKEKKKE